MLWDIGKAGDTEAGLEGCNAVSEQRKGAENSPCELLYTTKEAG